MPSERPDGARESLNVGKQALINQTIAIFEGKRDLLTVQK